MGRASIGRGKVLRARRGSPVSQVESLEGRRLFAAMVGLNSAGELVTFDSATPGTISSRVAVTGLADGESLVGIDYRPANGQLYAGSTASRIYTINLSTGAATAVGTGAFTPAASGTNFGFDFNPVPDRIRFVSDGGQNLRINPATGVAITDGNLAYATGDANEGATPNVTASAYVNPFGGATTTTLYGIDTNLDILVTQNPPNAGTLNTVGALGLNAAGPAGFDVGQDGIAYAALTTDPTGPSSLYTINLTTGAATLLGTVGATTEAGLIDVAAVPLARQIAYGITADGQLATFFIDNPGTLTATTAVTGLQTGETILGIDIRPATGELFALGSTSRLYVLNTTTGAATQVGTGTFTVPLSGTSFGFDFNPTVDRIRVVSNTGQDLRLNPITGAVVDSDATTDGVQPDGTLAFATGDANEGATPSAVASAYINSLAGATSTTLYNIDSGLDILVTQNPPNAGTLNTVGALGINATNVAGFDIVGTASNNALAVITVDGATTSTLYTISLSSGGATAIGTIGGTQTLTAFTLGLDYPVLNLSASTQSVAEDAQQVVVTVGRGGDTSGAVTVNYTLSSAALLADGTATTGTLNFADGATTATLTLNLADDDVLAEGDGTFTVTLSDPTGGALLGVITTQTVTVTDDDAGAAVELTDPDSSRVREVVVNGTSGDDVIEIVRRSGSRIEVFVGGESQGLFRSPRRVFVFAGDGNDVVQVNRGVSSRMIIVGGAGNDVLVAGRGKDLVFGGTGIDAVFGGSGEDIVLGGTTVYDADIDGLRAISNAWNSRGSYTTRVNRLIAGTGTAGGLLFSTAQITDDATLDIVVGEGSSDFYATNTTDVLVDRSTRERILA